jgi:hypothetical protein
VGHDQVYAWRRGYRPGHHDQTPVTRNERRGEQPPEHHDEVPCELNPGAGNNWAKARIHKSWARFLLNPPCSSAAFVVNSEPRTGARPSARMYVGLIAGRRRRRPRWVFVPQPQEAQQRLNHAFEPPSYGKISSSSKVLYIATRGAFPLKQRELLILALLLCLSAKCSSPAAAASRRCRRQSEHRPEHHDQVRATHSERRRGQRPGRNDQVPAVQ